jgi:hypothetical protein
VLDGWMLKTYCEEAQTGGSHKLAGCDCKRHFPNDRQLVF